MSFSQALSSQLKNLKKNNEKPLLPGTSSLLFNFKDANSISNEEAYNIGIHGLLLLSQTNPEFKSYSTTLFVSTAKYFNRETSLKEETVKIDSQIESLLVLLTDFFDNSNCHKILEYLIRVYQVNIYNPDVLIMSFLPFHDTRYFAKLIQNINFKSKNTHGSMGFLHTYSVNGQVLLKDNINKEVLKDFDLLFKIVEFCIKHYLNNSDNCNINSYLNFTLELLTNSVNYYKNLNKSGFDINNYVRLVTTFISSVVNKFSKIESKKFLEKFLELIILLISNFKLSKTLINALCTELLSLSYKISNFNSNFMDFNLNISDDQETLDNETPVSLIIKTLLAIVLEEEYKLEESNEKEKIKEISKLKFDKKLNDKISFVNDLLNTNKSLICLNSDLVVDFIETHIESIVEFSKHYDIFTLIKEFSLSCINKNEKTSNIVVAREKLENSIVKLVSRINLTSESVKRLILAISASEIKNSLKAISEFKEDELQQMYVEIALLAEELEHNQDKSSSTSKNMMVLLKQIENNLTESIVLDMNSSIKTLCREILSPVNSIFSKAIDRLDKYIIEEFNNEFEEDMNKNNKTNINLSKKIQYFGYFSNSILLRFQEEPVNFSILNKIICSKFFSIMLQNNNQSQVEIAEFVLNKAINLYSTNSMNIRNKEFNEESTIIFVSELISVIENLHKINNEVFSKSSLNKLSVSILLISSYLSLYSEKTSKYKVNFNLQLLKNGDNIKSDSIKLFNTLINTLKKYECTEILSLLIRNNLINQSYNSLFYTEVKNLIINTQSIYSEQFIIQELLEKEIEEYNIHNTSQDIYYSSNISLPIYDLVWNSIEIDKSNVKVLLKSKLLNIMFSENILEYALSKLQKSKQSEKSDKKKDDGSKLGLSKFASKITDESAYQLFLAYLIFNDIIILNSVKTVEIISELVKHPYSGVPGISLYSASKHSKKVQSISNNHNNTINEVKSLEFVFILALVYSLKYLNKLFLNNNNNKTLLISSLNKEFNSVAGLLLELINSCNDNILYSYFSIKSIFSLDTNKKTRSKDLIKKEDVKEIINQIFSKNFNISEENALNSSINKFLPKLFSTFELICLKELDDDDSVLIPALENIFLIFDVTDNDNSNTNTVNSSVINFVVAINQIQNYLNLLSFSDNESNNYSNRGVKLFESLLTSVFSIRSVNQESKIQKELFEDAMTIIHYQNNKNYENKNEKNKKKRYFSEIFSEKLITIIETSQQKIKPEQFIEIVKFMEFYPTVFTRLKQYNLKVDEDKVLEYLISHHSAYSEYHVLYITLDSLKFDEKSENKINLIFDLIDKNIDTVVNNISNNDETVSNTNNLNPSKSNLNKKKNKKENSSKVNKDNFDLKEVKLLDNLFLLVNSLLVNSYSDSQEDIFSLSEKITSSKEKTLTRYINLFYYLLDLTAHFEIKALKNDSNEDQKLKMEVEIEPKNYDENDKEYNYNNNNEATNNNDIISIISTHLRSFNSYYKNLFTLAMSKLIETNKIPETINIFSEEFYVKAISKISEFKLASNREKLLNSIIKFSMDSIIDTSISCLKKIKNNIASKSNSTNNNLINSSLEVNKLNSKILLSAQNKIHYLVISSITLMHSDYYEYLNNSLSLVLECHSTPVLSGDNDLNDLLFNLKVTIISAFTVNYSYANSKLSLFSNDQEKAKTHLLRNQLLTNFFQSPDHNSILVFVKESTQKNVSFDLKIRIITRILEELTKNRLDEVSNNECFFSIVKSYDDVNNNSNNNINLAKENAIILCGNLLKVMEREFYLLSCYGSNSNKIFNENDTNNEFKHSNTTICFSQIIFSLCVLSKQTNSIKEIFSKVLGLEKYFIETIYSYDLIEEQLIILLKNEHCIEFSSKLQTTLTAHYLSNKYLELIITDSSMRVKSQDARLKLVDTILSYITDNRDLISNWHNRNTVEVELVQVLIAITTKFVGMQETYDFVRNNFKTLIQIIKELHSTTGVEEYYNKSIIIKESPNKEGKELKNKNVSLVYPPILSLSYLPKPTKASFNHALYLKLSLLIYCMKIFISFSSKNKLMESFEEVIAYYLLNLFSHDYLDTSHELNSLLMSALEEVSRHCSHQLSLVISPLMKKLILETYSDKYKNACSSILSNCARACNFESGYSALKAVIKQYDKKKSDIKNLKIIISYISKMISKASKSDINSSYDKINKLYVSVFLLIENCEDESILIDCCNAYSQFVLKINEKQLREIFELVLSLGFKKKSKEEIKKQESGDYSEDEANKEDFNRVNEYKIGLRGSVKLLKCAYSLEYTSLSLIMMNVILNTIQSLYLPYFEKYQATFVVIITNVIDYLSNYCSHNNFKSNQSAVSKGELILKSIEDNNSYNSRSSKSNKNKDKNTESDDNNNSISDELDIETTDNKKVRVSLLGKKRKNIVNITNNSINTNFVGTNTTAISELPLRTEYQNPIILNTLLMKHLELLFKYSGDYNIDYQVLQELIGVIPYQLKLDVEELFYYKYFEDFTKSCFISLFSEIKDDDLLKAFNENVLSLTNDGSYVTKILVLRLVESLFSSLSERYLTLVEDTSNYIYQLIESDNEYVCNLASKLKKKIEDLDNADNVNDEEESS